MPSMDEFLELARKVAEHHGLEAPEQFYSDLSTQTRQAWPGERIYLIPLNSQKDPARGLAIKTVVRKLPTGIISDRMGISRQLVSYHTKK